MEEKDIHLYLRFLVQTPVGLGSTATATATVTDGSVTGVTVTYGGTGYTSAPQVLIDPPSLISETNDIISYNGDSGTVVGFGTTVVSDIDKLIFDFYIPQDSLLRDTVYCRYSNNSKSN